METGDPPDLNGSEMGGVFGEWSGDRIARWGGGLWSEFEREEVGSVDAVVCALQWTRLRT